MTQSTWGPEELPKQFPSYNYFPGTSLDPAKLWSCLPYRPVGEAIHWVLQKHHLHLLDTWSSQRRGQTIPLCPQDETCDAKPRTAPGKPAPSATLSLSTSLLVCCSRNSLHALPQNKVQHNFLTCAYAAAPTDNHRR